MVILYQVKLTEGYSGADVTNVCREAAMMGMRKQSEALRKARKAGMDIQELAKMFEANADIPVTMEVCIYVKNLFPSVQRKHCYQIWTRVA